MITPETALINLASSMDSPASQVVSTVLFVLLVIFWLLNVLYTIINVADGILIFGPTMAELEKKEFEERRKRHDEEF